MPRGRPRKVIVPVEEGTKSIQIIIADVIQEWCGTPGCAIKFHLGEASEIIDRLKESNYLIIEKVL